MITAQNNILNILKSIQGSGSFYYADEQNAILPGLVVEDFEELAFPLTYNQAKGLIAVANRAPYGKGSETITNLNVRRAWEIDKSKLSFRNLLWESFIESVVQKVKNGLGLEQKSLKASLNKLLIYEEGDFFLPHKDSEKEKGMFGTLIVALPSQHQGGELIIEFNNQVEKIEFSNPCQNYKIPFVAFYADCRHEVKPVTKGVRICLTYNLVQIDTNSSIKSPIFSTQISELSESLKKLEKAIVNSPLIAVLDHQYTATNFSLNQLKHGDIPRVEALLAAAKNQGYYAKLCLLTCYKMGSLDEDYNYDYNYNESIELGDNMGEVFEEYVEVNHWAISDTPDLGNLDVLTENLIMNAAFDEQEPIEKEAEGYMGNYGMTVEYWYHYGAVMIWHKSKHIDLLKEQPINIQIKWLDYYVKKWNTLNTEEKEEAKQLITFLDITSNHFGDENNFSSIISVLVNLDDVFFVSSNQIQFYLKHFFDIISTEMWAKFVAHYNFRQLLVFFKEIVDLNDIKKTSHLTTLLMELLISGEDKNFLFNIINRIPSNLKIDQFIKSYKSIKIKDLIVNLIHFSEQFKDENWLEKCELLLTNTKHRNYINYTLSEILLSGDLNETAPLFVVLHEFVSKNILYRTHIMPTPPKDWKRKIPPSLLKSEQGKIIIPFLDSPAEEVFDYKAAKQYRIEMEAYVLRANIYS